MAEFDEEQLADFESRVDELERRIRGLGDIIEEASREISNAQLNAKSIASHLERAVSDAQLLGKIK